MLAEHFHLSGDEESAEHWKKLALTIAEKGGMKEKFLQDLKEKNL
jgi:hypothetical protein